MMEALRTSETLVNFYQTTQRYNLEDSHLSIHTVLVYTNCRRGMRVQIVKDCDIFFSSLLLHRLSLNLKIPLTQWTQKGYLIYSLRMPDPYHIYIFQKFSTDTVFNYSPKNKGGTLQ
jgi:hypothetical protein